MEDISIGLWKTKSEKGTEYFRGVKAGVEINGKKYKVSLFTNSNKKSDKSPDMTIKLAELKEEIEVPQNYKTDYQDNIKIEDDDLPF